MSAVSITLVYLSQLTLQHIEEMSYIEDCIRNADPKSNFARYTKLIRWMPITWIIFCLKVLRYGVLMSREDGIITGSLFYQRHGSALHVFSIKSHVGMERGVGPKLVDQFLYDAFMRQGITAVRLGAGKSKKMTSFVKALACGAIYLTFMVDVTMDGWVRFPTKLKRT